ncbi:catalase/peroxidase HPI [Gammaproteobacteria bacterium]|nr:catalase/peroxidase HPI [Gammaproteobacteria bacterium]
MTRQILLSSVMCLIGLGAVTISGAQDQLAINEYWWPNRLNLEPLREDSSFDPSGGAFNYADAFQALNLDDLVNDLTEVMTTSQDWWPADYGNYGPFFVRMAWHSAGTYRSIDGRGGSDGGMQRFAPLNSWPDNANLDKARLLLLPIKQKYGSAISWADLMILAGTVAMDSMGFETLGFAGGRVDLWQPEDVNWGPEGEWLAADRRDENGELIGALGASQMGLIYVNPQGPGGNSDPQSAADAIRETFGRMAMNDEETVALIAGGHTFGKAHGAASPDDYVGSEPERESIESQGKGWLNKYGSGKGADTITSGLEGAWTSNPVAWTHDYLVNLYGYEWEQTRSPAGAVQWKPIDGAASNLVPDAHDSSKRHAPMMFTTDLALRVDPAYREITSRWLENPEEFSDAYARAWFKLTHRDMGPSSRYLGKLVPAETFVWQDPVPAVDFDLVTERDVSRLKTAIMESGLTTAELVETAWASASTYRGTDMRGGANGARVGLAPQRSWEVNNPEQLNRVLEVLEEIQGNFNSNNRRKKISLADVIVLGGAAAIESAAGKAGVEIDVPFVAGRTDASQDQTDIASFSLLRPMADGFRNYFSEESPRSPPEMLVEKAALLGLTAPEMTVLVGGLRVLNVSSKDSAHGVFTSQPGLLTNDFFVNLVDLSTQWTQSASLAGVYEGRDLVSGELKWTASPVDLIFGSNSELRAIAEHYSSDDALSEFVEAFTAAWVKVMTLDRFDLES